MSLKLEVGKNYKDRNGDLIRIYFVSEKQEFPFIGRLVKLGNIRSFTENGQYTHMSNISPHSWDLIEEVK